MVPIRMSFLWNFWILWMSDVVVNSFTVGPVPSPCSFRARMRMRIPPLSLLPVDVDMSSVDMAASALTTVPLPLSLEDANSPIRLSDGTIVTMFVAGVTPFAWATVEFWRRIVGGLPFGTGSDSVVVMIGEDDRPESSRGRQVLGRGALVTAYLLFGIAGASIAVALLGVLTSVRN